MAKPTPKLEFDKDYIFNLIMPTDGRVGEPLSPAAQPEAEDSEDARDGLAELRARLFASPIPAAQTDTGQAPVLVNLMEAAVLLRMESALARFVCCRCDKCRQEIARIALNSLPPFYLPADPKNLRPYLEAIPAKGVSDAVVKAIIYVKNNPKH